MRWLRPSVLTGIHLWKEWRTHFDCIRDITVMNCGQFTASIGPSTTSHLPCRRCGQAAEVPIPSDSLCGGPIVPRKRLNPEYKEPLAFGNEANQMNTARPSIPPGNRTGVIEERERSGLEATNASSSKEEVQYPPSELDQIGWNKCLVDSAIV